MQFDILFVVLAGILSIVLLLMRTNMALTILGLCAGYVFSDVFSDRLAGFLYENNYTAGSLPIASVASITLILFPSLLIALRFRHQQKNRAIQHMVPIFAFVGLLAVLILNNLPINYKKRLVDESIVFDLFNRYELFVIAGVVMLAIFDVMIFEYERKRHMSKIKKKNKKRHKD